MGVFQQRTIQQGDKNAVATQQRTMQHTLRDDWGKNVTVYVDDGTIYDEKAWYIRVRPLLGLSLNTFDIAQE